MEETAPESSAGLRIVEKYVYKCNWCPRKFTTCQGLAGHMNAHRSDVRYVKGCSHVRIPYYRQPSATVPSTFPVTFRPPSVAPWLEYMPAPMPATIFTHAPASVAVHPSFAGLGHAPLPTIPPRVRVVRPRLVNRNRGLVRAFQGLERSSETTMTDPKAGVAAQRGEEEEVTSKETVVVDLELKLGR
ncbi:hypothetical protein HYC85_022413 [Camellia sinensis]|uniref:C2H2-type domain-containing protein n=1 Tax=Camellia sinensis TaxID=4442 RepID=A0A7J7GP77_CAMSI|nr:hypothetical protein HYC85_022413 [Camellia sinensis]